MYGVYSLVIIWHIYEFRQGVLTPRQGVLLLDFADLGIKYGRQTGSAIDYKLYLYKSTNLFVIWVLICDEFNGAIYFIFRKSDIAAKQEVASITTYVYTRSSNLF